ncbi:MAG: cytochrome c biogenesis protein CcdA, partial [Merismopedia sp. SIO2A8]|nr:cytochrome c biogenesis protein CcdA [Merismopedia sp. SIO2A8]
FDAVQTVFYKLEVFANHTVATELSHLGPVSLIVIFAAGLLTSITPCTLSMLPLTVGYMGGYDTENRIAAARQSLWFALGLATTLALLGTGAAIAGQVYGQVGVGLPILVSLIAIAMGFNLLELLPLNFPSIGTTEWIASSWPKGIRAYVVGLTFGLVASPCSTPVLATLLAWVMTLQQPLWGGLILLAYTAGYVVPLIIAGTFTAMAKQLLTLRQWSGWITPVSGVILIGFGVFTLLSRLIPAIPA